MNTFNSKDNKYINAKKRVEELKGFYYHIISTLFIIPLLIFINYKTSWGFQWFWFPVGGISISIIIHAFTVFGFGSEWEDRKVRELMEKEDKY